jgi:hypothetical protein
MLHRSLHELAAGSLLGGSRLTRLLTRHLHDTAEAMRGWLGNREFAADCREALIADLDERWPRTFRLNELENIATEVCPGSFLVGPEIPAMDALFNELIELDGELICFRPAHVQAYMRLSAEIEPAVLVAWHLAGRVVAPSSLTPASFTRLVSLKTSFFEPRAFAHSPVAENHAHLGGVFGDGPVLGRLVLDLGDRELAATLNSWTLHEDREVLPRLRRARSLVQTFLRLWREGPEKSTPEAVAYALESASQIDSFTSLTSSQVNWENLVSGLDVGQAIDRRWILFQIARAMTAANLQLAWQLLFVGLWYIYRTPSTSVQERVAVLAIIGELTILRRRLVMDGRGLRRFTERYYNPTLRKLARQPSASVDKDTARRIFVEKADMAELKVGPDGFDPSIVASLSKAIDGQEPDPMRGLLPPAKDGSLEAFRAARGSTFNRWHLCVHFSRSGKDGTSARRAGLWDEADALVKAASATARWTSAGLLGGNEVPTYYFEPANFLRGLDVAGDETRWPIEVFAPTLRWLRGTQIGQHDAREAIPRPHFSIHAGEDYSHPISGMRHVDETVRFCEMSHGDRLGHALALGIAPSQWFARHGEALIDVDEHLDNLIWTWNGATILSGKLPLAAQVLPRLQRRISRFARHASWTRQTGHTSLFAPQSIALRNGGAPTPAELHEAWILRRNCPHMLSRADPRMPLLDSKLAVSLPDHRRLFAEITNPGQDTAAALFLARALREAEPGNTKGVRVLVKTRPVERLYQNSLEQLPPSSTLLLHDHEEAEELEFMEALQDFLLDDYERLGLVLEANPTSNVYIGVINDYREHPIFRWDPPDVGDLVPGGSHNRFGLRRGPILVTINTDDQGIMPTTMRTELHIMREAAVDRGASGSIADKWIERIRLEGIEQFKRNHRPVFELR